MKILVSTFLLSQFLLIQNNSAHFTGCTINKVDKVLIGGTESYVALCRNCYVELQNSISNQEISYDILNSSGSSCESDKNSEEKEHLL